MGKPTILAIYKGDRFLCLGTAQECANLLGITKGSLQSRISPSKQNVPYEKRLIAVRLEGGEEDEST